MRAVNAPTVKRAQQHGFRVRNKMRLFQRRRKVFLWYIGPVYSRPGQNCLINVKERIKIILPLKKYFRSRATVPEPLFWPCSVKIFSRFSECRSEYVTYMEQNCPWNDTNIFFNKQTPFFRNICIFYTKLFVLLHGQFRSI